MTDFFRHFDKADVALKERVEGVLDKLEAVPIKELLSREYKYALTHYRCPLCPNSFPDFLDLLNHIQQRRWEFQKLLWIVENLPRHFEFGDFLYKDGVIQSRLYYKLRRWVLACKLMEKINPHGLRRLNPTRQWRKEYLYKAALLWQV